MLCRTCTCRAVAIGKSRLSHLLTAAPEFEAASTVLQYPITFSIARLSIVRQ